MAVKGVQTFGLNFESLALLNGFVVIVFALAIIICVRHRTRPLAYVWSATYLESECNPYAKTELDQQLVHFQLDRLASYSCVALPV